MKKLEVVDIDKLKNSPSLRYGHSTCVINDFLYLFGGSSLDGKDFFDSLHILDLIKKEWVEKIDAPKEISGRHFHTCVSAGGRNACLLFFGGKANGYKNDVFTFDIKKKEFKIIEPRYKDNEKKNSCVNEDVQPPSPRYGHSACFANNMLYIFGGYDQNGFTKNDLYSFNLRTNMWKKYVIARIPYRYHHTGIYVNGSYYIIGGIRKNYKPLNDIYLLELPKSSTTNEEEDEGEEEEEDTKIEIITKEEEEEKKIDDHAVEAFKLSVRNPIASYGHKCFIFQNQIHMYGGRDQKKEFKHLPLDEKGVYEDLEWKEIPNFDFKFDEEKLLVSYGSLDVYNDQLLFFGGQHRGEKIIINQEEEEEEGEHYESDELPYDTIFEILSYLEEKDLVSVSSVSRSWTISKASRSDRIWGRKYKNLYRATKISGLRLKKVKRRKTCYDKYRALKYQEFLVKEEKEKLELETRKLLEKKSVAKIKCVVVGDGAVGKTCFLMSYLNGTFPIEYIPTVIEVHNVKMAYKENSIELALWDTAGEEEYCKLRSFTYLEANCFLICFSLVEKSSLENVKNRWIPELLEDENSNAIYILVGTKSDLLKDEEYIKRYSEHYEPVSKLEAENFAKEIGAVCYFETSAKTGKGIRVCFDAIPDAVLKNTSKKVNESRGKCGVM